VEFTCCLIPLFPGALKTRWHGAHALPRFPSFPRHRRRGGMKPTRRLVSFPSRTYLTLIYGFSPVFTFLCLYLDLVVRNISLCFLMSATGNECIQAENCKNRQKLIILWQRYLALSINIIITDSYIQAVRLRWNCEAHITIILNGHLLSDWQ
jgi:hypothetical protein